MTEYLVEHNWSRGWASVTIPETGDALVVSADPTGKVVETSPLSRDMALETIAHCQRRTNEYTVTEVR